MRRLLIVLMCLVVPSLAQAATYYVNKAGSDANSCVTAQSDVDANAKLTIGAGIGCATTAGDLLLIGDGTYDETLRTAFAFSGTSGNPITYRAENAKLTIIRFTGDTGGFSMVVVPGSRS